MWNNTKRIVIIGDGDEAVITTYILAREKALLEN
jgi:hypothetical protein